MRCVQNPGALGLEILSEKIPYLAKEFRLKRLRRLRRRGERRFPETRCVNLVAPWQQLLLKHNANFVFGAIPRRSAETHTRRIGPILSERTLQNFGKISNFARFPETV